MKGVIYARYSSDSQREESIEGQLRECMEYAEKNGITILGNYIDRAMSAKTDNRPEFQRMIKDSHKKMFDVAIVWKLDRFARNRYDSARYKAILKKNDVRVLSATEKIEEGSAGILLESVLEGMAEYYSADLSEKVSRGMTENALKCKYNGGNVPVGYTINSERHFEVDPLTAPLVLQAFTMYADGKGMQKIVDYFDDKGIKTNRNTPITFNVISRMLKNRRYIGEYSFSDVVMPDGVPPIVPIELFDRVQERTAKNKKTPARNKAEDDYLLTTKLFCGYCGAFMVGESGTSQTGKIHRYYKCVTAKRKKDCSKKSVQKGLIENAVIADVQKVIFDDKIIGEMIDKILDLQKSESTILPLLKKQLKEAQKGINNMLNAIQEGIFTSSTKERLEELEDTKNKLEVSILEEEMQKPVLTKKHLQIWFHEFRKLDITIKEHRQRLIDSFVNSIYLYDNEDGKTFKALLNINFKDGVKAVTLEDIGSSDMADVSSPNNPHK